MTPTVLGLAGAALLCACAPFTPNAAAAASAACTATASRPTSDARIRLAIDEAHRQHRAFGGQTVERNGGMFRVGFHEAEWGRPAGESLASWERIATYWRALSEADPQELRTSLGPVARAEASPGQGASGTDAERREVAVREALLRAAIVDTPWSAAFISYLMKEAGFSPAEFAFSDSHADYVQEAFAASAAEAEGRSPAYAFRACDVATTRPRAGDLLCATRARTTDITRFDALATALAGRSAGQAFPMHCELVVLSDEGGDAKLETMGGNVVNSVTLSRMTLNEDKVLSDAYIARSEAQQDCAGGVPPCRGHLSRRPWSMLMQFRY
jgi:hypothetical protein